MLLSGTPGRTEKHTKISNIAFLSTAEYKPRRGPIRQNKDIDPSEGVSKPTKVTLEKPRRGPIRQNKDINPSEGANQPTKAKAEEA